MKVTPEEHTGHYQQRNHSIKIQKELHNSNVSTPYLSTFIQSAMTCASSSGENSIFPDFDWKYIIYSLTINTFMQNQFGALENAVLDDRCTVEG